MSGKKPGLVYAVMDGQKITQGAPYRSSSLPHQPTMETVSRRINAGKKVKGDRIAGVRRATDAQLSLSTDWSDFQMRLSRIGVEVMPHVGKDNALFGVSFIDVRQRGIYTGSELGKAFTAASLKKTLGDYQPPMSRQPMEEVNRQTKQQTLRQAAQEHRPVNQPNQNTDERTIVPNLELVRQLLYALGQDVGLDPSEQELKSMLKKSRKPRMS